MLAAAPAAVVAVWQPRVGRLAMSRIEIGFNEASVALGQTPLGGRKLIGGTVNRKCSFVRSFAGSSPAAHPHILANLLRCESQKLLEHVLGPVLWAIRCNKSQSFISSGVCECVCVSVWLWLCRCVCGLATSSSEIAKIVRIAAGYRLKYCAHDCLSLCAASQVCIEIGVAPRIT